MNKVFDFLHRHRYDFLCFFILISLIVLTFLIFPKEETKNVIKDLENKSFDIRQKVISKNKKVNEDIIIISVDDPSYEFLTEKYGDWPIPRNVYGEMLEYVQSQNPKYVAFDLLFINTLSRVSGSNKKLIDGFKKYQNTYTAMNFDNYSFDLRKPPIINKKLKTNIKIESDSFKPTLFTNSRLIMNEIIEVTDNVAHINTPKSSDGLIRTVPIIVDYPQYNPNDLSINQIDHYLYMTFKMAVDYLNKYENANIKKLIVSKDNKIHLGNRTIPLTNNGEVIINWYGESGMHTNKSYKYVSFWEVIKSLEAKQNGEKEVLPSDLFKDKIVYFGTNVYSLSDIKTVPTSKYFPGVEVHATLFNNILDNNLIKKIPALYNILITIILAAAAAYIVFKVRSVYFSIFLFTTEIISYIYLTTFAMAKYNLWIWIIIPIMVSIFIFICSFIIKYLIKSRDFEYTYKLATTDGLTELYNHRFFQEQIRRKIVFSDKMKTPFSLILIDIDFFKKFNDKYGHQAGDAVLKHVAKTLKSSVRSEDLVCRYGGEEMAILLNNVNKEIAIKTAQKICDAIASRNYELTPEITVNITISLGVSSYPDNGKTPEELIEYADKGLYKAKENGRNQVGLLD